MTQTLTVRTIFYNGETLEEFTYEDTTTLPFKKWLKEHNKERRAEGNLEECSDDFVVYEAEIRL